MLYKWEQRPDPNHNKYRVYTLTVTLGGETYCQSCTLHEEEYKHPIAFSHMIDSIMRHIGRAHINLPKE